MATVTDKPLFIPLRGEYFDAFVSGTKNTEFRKYGPRWNEKTCWVGRPVMLSRGYGKQSRRAGHIVGFTVSREPTRSDDWRACYGETDGMAACIHIELTDDAH